MPSPDVVGASRIPAAMPTPTAPRSSRSILYATAFLRAVGTSLVGVLLAVYLHRLGLSPRAIGPIVSAGLAGAAFAALLSTLLADRVGRRRSLMLLSSLTALGTLAFVLSTHPGALAVAAFAGMLNGMGRDRGAALVIEQAMLPATATDETRTRTIARYTMLQDVGHAVGSLLAGLPTFVGASSPLEGAAADRALLSGCAALAFVSLLLYRRLAPGIEVGASAAGPALSAASRRILVRISSLFAVDSLAGGFLTTSLLSYFFFERFKVSEGVIAALFFTARLMNALSHLGAAWLARRIGLVNTMVFTHVPSSLLLVTVAFAPSFPVAAALFLLREGLVEMDVPTRQSYVMAVVAPEERTLASGVTNLVRLVAWAVAPTFAGALMTGSTLFVPLVVGALMKIAYDALLYAAFRRVQPPEERSA